MTIENFNKFYDEYQRFSAYVAYCITKDKLLAEDISQEIFITLYKMRENLDYSDHKKLKALVFRATTNRCNDYFRKPSTKQEMCTFDEEGVEETPDERGDPEAQLLRMEEETYQRLVLRKLRMRNPQNYDILIKTKMHRIPASEVAEEYGITTNNVNNRNLRSKAWIIEELEKLRRQSPANLPSVAYLDNTHSSIREKI